MRGACWWTLSTWGVGLAAASPAAPLRRQDGRRRLSCCATLQTCGCCAAAVQFCDSLGRAVLHKCRQGSVMQLKPLECGSKNPSCPMNSASWGMRRILCVLYRAGLQAFTCPWRVPKSGYDVAGVACMGSRTRDTHHHASTAKMNLSDLCLSRRLTCKHDAHTRPSYTYSILERTILPQR
jgi:hypothetical protein